MSYRHSQAGMLCWSNLPCLPQADVLSPCADWKGCCQTHSVQGSQGRLRNPWEQQESLGAAGIPVLQLRQGLGTLPGVAAWAWPWGHLTAAQALCRSRRGLARSSRADTARVSTVLMLLQLFGEGLPDAAPVPASLLQGRYISISRSPWLQGRVPSADTGAAD